MVRFLHFTWSDKIASDISEIDGVGNSKILLLHKSNFLIGKKKKSELTFLGV